MNEKEVSEIRRRYKPDKSNISTIRGCYVNENGEIVSEFNQPVSLMPEDEAEKFLSILKKTLSGTLDKNLINIEFTTKQVTDSNEHKLLMALKDSALKNDDAVHDLFQYVIQTVRLEDNYVILLAHDVYDIPYRSFDGAQQNDASSEVFSYVLCSICPVKQTKPALSYFVYENEFHSRVADWVVSPPELGFMFPAFDDRSSNIYGTLYYSRDTAKSYDSFVDTIFHCELPMPAAEQKETFQTMLGNTLADDCRMHVVQAVHDDLQEMIEEHKENKEEEPLKVSKNTIRHILETNGVSEESVAAFSEQFDASFGADTNLSPKNIIDTKKIEVTTPNVTIQVKPEHGNLVETRVIDGAKYILIRAEQGVELNGIPVHITDESMGV
ncbi:MAG: DUF4317 domain-containing protein [Oscillospiraceae bacterium]